MFQDFNFTLFLNIAINNCLTSDLKAAVFEYFIQLLLIVEIINEGTYYWSNWFYQRAHLVNLFKPDFAYYHIQSVRIFWLLKCVYHKSVIVHFVPAQEQEKYFSLQGTADLDDSHIVQSKFVNGWSDSSSEIIIINCDQLWIANVLNIHEPDTIIILILTK